MSPLRRPIAMVGLVALAMTAFLLLTQQISMEDAALRALLVLVFAKGLDRLAAWGLHRAAAAAARVSHRGQIARARLEPSDEQG